MTWGIALSGGMAFGLSNIGILEVLDAECGKPDCVAGSSMGAIVGALYALGHPVQDLRKMAGEICLLKVASLSKTALKGGLHGGVLRQRLEDVLLPLVGDAVIGDCAIPFVCVAGRVTAPIRWERIARKGFVEHIEARVEKYVFPPHTRILDALLATSAVPVVFSPVELDGNVFVDLCDYGAVPARTLCEECAPEIVIGTNTVPHYGAIEKVLPASWKEYLIAGRASLAESLASCDLVIEPALPAPFYRFDKASAFMEAGKEAAQAAIPKLKELIKR